MWVDNLPAFWASFALTITSTLGPSVLALPIVFMSFGPVAAALMILSIGAINTLTLAYLAESQLRAGPTLRKLGFSQIIEHYLGSSALNFLKASLFLYCIVVLFAFTGGFLDAITSTIGASGIVWFVALYLFVVWYLSPRNHAGSLVSAFAIALINLAIIVGFTVAILIVVAMSPNTLSLDSAPIGLKFPSTPILIAIGAALYSFAGHISVSNGAQLVLHRRGSEKGFLRGAVIGLGTISVIYAIWAFAAISALTSGILSQNTSVLQSLSLYFGPWASAISIVFIVLSLGIGSGNYAMAAHHVLVDTIKRLRMRRDKAPAAGRSRGPTTVWSLEHVTGIAIITLVMGTALFSFTLSVVDLNQFFGLIGGSMAPIIAGVFPILIFVACRRRGVFAESGAVDFLSGKIVSLLSLTAFLSIYIWQATSDNYALWYRSLSIAICLSLLGLLYSLYRKGKFSMGGVILIEKGKDGWDPRVWKIFEEGCVVNKRSLSWKTTSNGEFGAISSSTSPTRVLSAVRLDMSQMKSRNFDVNVLDTTTDHPVEFVVDQSDPAFLKIVIEK
jgi:hypothetical protein